MTKEEIIEMAIHLGAEEMKYVTDMEGPTISIKFRLENDSLEKFAKLIAKKERENLCKYFQGLEGMTRSKKDKMYLSAIQFAIRARGQE